jgi:hypothetical protein
VGALVVVSRFVGRGEFSNAGIYDVNPKVHCTFGSFNVYRPQVRQNPRYCQTSHNGSSAITRGLCG